MYYISIVSEGQTLTKYIILCNFYTYISSII